MVAAVVTTGSTVAGLVPGLAGGLGNNLGISLIGVLGNPSGVVTPVYLKTIAYDATNSKYFLHISGDYGNVWNELGSIEFT